MRVLVPFGTRPEIVKLAPVVHALRNAGLEPRTLATGQHYDISMTGAFFEELALQPDEIWTLSGDEAERIGGILTLAHRELAATRPDLVLVCGDTHTVPLFCLAARALRIPIAHIEAGMRSRNETSLEEVDRKVAAATAQLHLAPTTLAADFLRQEGVDPARIRVVGNPVIDAVRASGVERVPPEEREGMLFTAHRATNVDDPERLARLYELLLALASRYGPVRFPIHPRTRARLEGAGLDLAAADISLSEPLPYGEMLRAIAGSRVVVTDSGGLQEESSWLGVPTVVLRRSTPRWETVISGAATLVGLDVELALEAVARFDEPEEQERVASLPCPFGDGHAADRIAALLADASTAPLLRIRETDYVGKTPLGAVSAVLFDLDDTLFAQADWLDAAWRAVARAAVPYGVAEEPFRAALVSIAAEGSGSGRIIDRALEAVGAADVPLEPLLEAFRATRCALTPHPGVREALADLRRVVPLGLVSDGDPAIQRAKLEALELEDAFDVVVLSDELGRALRKPNAAPFRAALEALGVEAAEAVYVGDNPAKDVSGAIACGMRAIRVETGEHAGRPDELTPWARVSDVLAAIDLLRPLLAGVAAGREHDQLSRV